MKPLLFLDVDGVVHALVGELEGGQRVHVRFERRPVYSTREGPRERDILIPAGMRDRLLALHEAFAIVYASAWQEEAPRVLSELLEVPAWSWLPFRKRKVPPMIRFAAGPPRTPARPFAWADDRVREELEAAEGYPERWPREDAMALTVNPRTGLSDHDVETLLGWAARKEVA